MLGGMKFGIIGSGMISRFHARAIQEMNGSELVAVFGQREAAARALAEEFKVKPFWNLTEFLAEPGLEIVTIGTPSGAHLEPALAALAAGKHVVCEKPLEITTERIDLMIDAAQRNGMTLAAILNRRFHPAMEHFRAAVHGGRLGRLTSASAYVKWFRGQEYYDSAAWRGTWELDGGGALMNQAIHTVDGLLDLAGPVRAVQASAVCLAHERIEVEDCVVALLEFKNGARGTIEASTCAWSAQGHPARIQICGTEGSVFLADETFEVWDFMEPHSSDDDVRTQLMARAGAGLGANDPTAIAHQQHRRNFEEIVAAIVAGREPATSAVEARKSVELIRAIYESAANDGSKVEL